jgi:hypothetical protein
MMNPAEMVLREYAAIEPYRRQREVEHITVRLLDALSGALDAGDYRYDRASAVVETVAEVVWISEYPADKRTLILADILRKSRAQFEAAGWRVKELYAVDTGDTTSLTVRLRITAHELQTAMLATTRPSRDRS